MGRALTFSSATLLSSFVLNFPNDMVSRSTRQNRYQTTSVISLVFVMLFLAACKHDHLPSLSTGGIDYTSVNLVADTAGYSSSHTDTNLANPWGMAISTKGSIWISCNHKGNTVVYDSTGNQLIAPVGIPLHGIANGSSPSGVAYNSTTSFQIGGSPAKFIYCTEDGIIAAWAKGDTTVTMADRSGANTVYKGIAIANDGTANYLYATDFFNDHIDVYNSSFQLDNGHTLSDPTIPSGFAPFNIRNIGGKLFVTYAKQRPPDNHDDESGTGNGFIDVFSPSGTLIKRFATQGALNSPWGIAQAPASFGQGAGAILVANFGDGTTLIFDSTGNYKGPLEDQGVPLFIDGIWDIAFLPSQTPVLYFTAGPQDETYGLFGYIKPR
jgi:uncharacterized protein (TIGR03118 family)